ncbi:MAG: hypothetical protein MHM6MM_006508 [Cercozoa sp. M6MM]
MSQLAKSYFQYVAKSRLGVINSAAAPVLLCQGGHWALCASCEDVVVWDVRKGVALLTLQGGERTVRSLAVSRQGLLVAAGDEGGHVRVYDLSQYKNDDNMTQTEVVPVCSYKAHRSSVDTLVFVGRERVFSGGADSDIVCWDVVANQGLYRLKGHSNGVTGLAHIPALVAGDEEEEGSHDEYLVSCSKDTFLKVWHLSSRLCVQTRVAHAQPVWSLAYCPQRRLLATGGADQELRLWEVVPSGKGMYTRATAPSDQDDEKKDEMQDTDDVDVQIVRLVGDIGVMRRSSKRVVSVQFARGGRVLLAQSADKQIEVLQVRNDQELRQALRRRRTRHKAKQDETATDGSEAPSTEMHTVTAGMMLKRMPMLRVSAKVSSFSCHRNTLLIATVDNTVSLFTHRVEGDSSDEWQTVPLVELAKVDLPGHRSVPRVVALNADASALLSAANDSAKVWNVASRKCVRTLLLPAPALCAAFLPGGRHVVIGTKEGTLLLFELGAAALVQTLTAHDGPVWSLDVRRDGAGLATGGGDGKLKCFDLTLQDGVLQLEHVQTLELEHDVLCVRYSQERQGDPKYIAASTLDNSIRVFFTDSLKFHL